MTETLTDKSPKSPEKKKMTKSERRATVMAEYILGQIPPIEERYSMHFEFPAWKVPGKPNRFLMPRIDDATVEHLQNILADEELRVSVDRHDAIYNTSIIVSDGRAEVEREAASGVEIPSPQEDSSVN